MKVVMLGQSGQKSDVEADMFCTRAHSLSLHSAWRMDVWGWSLPHSRARNALYEGKYVAVNGFESFLINEKSTIISYQGRG